MYYSFVLAVAVILLIQPSSMQYVFEKNNLNNVISSSYLLQHDFLKCFSDGQFKDMDEASHIFAENHFKYSQNFADYLQTVTGQIEAEFTEPLLEEMQNELGNYERKDMNTFSEFGIDQKWYHKIPHSHLSKRFFDSFENHTDISNSPGQSFTNFMIELYEQSNECESLAIVAFDDLSKLYEYIWNGLKSHTTLSHDKIVIFPLHTLTGIVHSNLVKSSFERYRQKHASACSNVENVIKNVLKERIHLYDNIRKQIEEKQNYKCQLPYSYDGNNYSILVGGEHSKYIAVAMHVFGFLFVLLRD